MRQPIHQQPKVSAAHQLLTTYTHEGLALDLYGTHDEDGYEVLDVALAGTNISLWEIVTLEFLDRLATWCNDHLPTGAELRFQSLVEARAERAKWEREAA
jgi:hypothetical protein